MAESPPRRSGRAAECTRSRAALRTTRPRPVSERRRRWPGGHPGGLPRAATGAVPRYVLAVRWRAPRIINSRASTIAPACGRAGTGVRSAMRTRVDGRVVDSRAAPSSRPKRSRRRGGARLEACGQQVRVRPRTVSPRPASTSAARPGDAALHEPRVPRPRPPASSCRAGR